MKRTLPARLYHDRALRLFLEHIERMANPPEQIVLYGSRARGDHRPDSDYDLLVMLSKRSPEVVDELYRAVQAVEMETMRLLSLLIRTREQYDIALSRGERVLRGAEEEGYLLWSKSQGNVFAHSGKKAQNG